MNSDMLRIKRKDTVINTESKVQEKTFIAIVKEMIDEVSNSLDVTLSWKSRLYATETCNVVENGVYENSKSYITPDGGFVFIELNGKSYPIFIGEVKKQGTNNKRAQEGKKKQAKGNAIERLGKNVSELRTWLWMEDIFPFVCFGYGCDFGEGSTILDRVLSISCRSPLNNINVYRTPREGFQSGTYFFREEQWTEQEMKDVISTVMKESISYYIGKYGK